MKRAPSLAPGSVAGGSEAGIQNYFLWQHDDMRETTAVRPEGSRGGGKQRQCQPAQLSLELRALGSLPPDSTTPQVSACISDSLHCITSKIFFKLLSLLTPPTSNGFD